MSVGVNDVVIEVVSHADVEEEGEFVSVTVAVVEALVEAVTLEVIVEVRETLGEVVGLCVSELLAEMVTKIVIVAERVPETDATAPPPEVLGNVDSEEVEEVVGVTVYDTVMAPDRELDAELVRITDIVVLLELDGDRVPVAETLDETEFVPESLGVAVEDKVRDKVEVTDADADVVVEGVEEIQVDDECVVVVVTLAHEDTVEDAESECVAFPLRDKVGEAETEADDVEDAVKLDMGVSANPIDEDAETVFECVEEIHAVVDCDVDGVTLAQEVEVEDTEAVGVVLPVGETDDEPVYNPDEVENADELAVTESVATIDEDKVAVNAAVEETHAVVVCDVIGVTLAHAVEVEDTEAVGVVLPVSATVDEPVYDPDEVENADELNEAESVPTTVPLTVEVEETDCVLVGVDVIVPLVVALFIDEKLPEGLGVDDVLYVDV